MQVLEKVELVVPSNLTAPLRVCDVPGFGDDTLDPFRQQLVNEALKLQCSTLCLVLKHGRLKDDAQEAAKRLGKLGICTPLFPSALLAHLPACLPARPLALPACLST